MAAEWIVDTDLSTATVTSHEDLLFDRLMKVEHWPLSFYRGTVLVASATGIVYRSEMWGGKYSLTMKLDEIKVHLD